MNFTLVLATVTVFWMALLLLLRNGWKKQVAHWRCEYGNMERSRDTLSELIVKRESELQGWKSQCEQLEKKCGGCFLNQAALRRKIGDLETEEAELARRLGESDGNYDRVMKELSAEKRSNAALRGRLTKLKGKKP